MTSVFRLKEEFTSTHDVNKHEGFLPSLGDSRSSRSIQRCFQDLSARARPGSSHEFGLFFSTQNLHTVKLQTTYIFFVFIFKLMLTCFKVTLMCHTTNHAPTFTAKLNEQLQQQTEETLQILDM